MGETIAAASAIYSIYNSEQTRKDANNERKKQEANAKKLEADAINQERIQESTVQRDQARARQRQLAMGNYGRSDTILTKKLGSVTGKKRLLGA